uniref:Uncharacterized protein AlNc14C125G6798 n=1 Tax=Albugo laibachii Nc14 TaxID=890382 RepID=F0WJS2_9STRA|nr:conserved hypothetical protein [Albugo laibachii Nc14]|eukprot:CCA21523.1 conserved hypothetical protein [Albugo laibachii Nc14]
MDVIDFNDFQVTFPEDVEDALQAAYGSSKWDSIKKALAYPPQETTIRIHTTQCSPQDAHQKLSMALNAINPQLTAQKHALIHEIIQIPSMHPNTSLKYDYEKASLIVDRLCGEAVLRGSDIFARGVMCLTAGCSANVSVNILVDLDHKNLRGSDLNAHRGRKLFIGVGRTRMSRIEILKADRGLAVSDIVRVCHNAPPLNGLESKVFYLQQFPSAMVGHVIHPQNDDYILDMCAAPGGKTTHMANLMTKGLIIAVDRSRRKVGALKRLLQDLGLGKRVIAIHKDSTQLLRLKSLQMAPRPSIEKLMEMENSHFRGFYPESFDKILLDPPCSALGLRPRLLHPRDTEALEQFVKIQRNLIWCAVRLLKADGVLVFSTCTLHPRENEKMVAYVLETYPFMKLIAPFENDPNLRFGSKGLDGQGLSNEQVGLVQRFDPTIDDTIGFFCAKFQKSMPLEAIVSEEVS